MRTLRIAFLLISFISSTFTIQCSIKVYYANIVLYNCTVLWQLSCEGVKFTRAYLHNSTCVVFNQLAEAIVSSHTNTKHGIFLSLLATLL